MSAHNWRASLAFNRVESYMRRRVGEIDISITLDVQEIAHDAAVQNVIRYDTGD